MVDSHTWQDSKLIRYLPVAILFRPNLDYEMTSKYSDNIGRVLWLIIKLKERLCSLVNIYTPNGEAPQIHFYNHLHNIFEQNARENHLYFTGGDLNYISNPQLDRRGGKEKKELDEQGKHLQEEVDNSINDTERGNLLTSLNECKNKLQDFLDYRTQGLLLGCKAQYYKEGEKIRK